eukprot:CAMPEP_0198357312 /NCGR_PEP_ID=MMETSP1450-20131203/126402_1 /TAXON_ID=753684 ORGANISM="Madagascaria erythrocladiodes, Strain CCMP3234" /NCGR_SAMPLE_ID=MMETSP1450 /ASSEMBLY_ACC=CAM_ASM_001115 /LENGTH=53 /DNA_ID=CAMNT_0044063923 /DNA_START=61 /DNA_END=218 /DNA_ORIENTATION=-
MPIARTSTLGTNVITAPVTSKKTMMTVTHAMRKMARWRESGAVRWYGGTMFMA